MKSRFAMGFFKLVLLSLVFIGALTIFVLFQLSRGTSVPTAAPITSHDIAVSLLNIFTFPGAIVKDSYDSDGSRLAFVSTHRALYLVDTKDNVLKGDSDKHANPLFTPAFMSGGLLVYYNDNTNSVCAYAINNDDDILWSHIINGSILSNPIRLSGDALIFVTGSLGYNASIICFSQAGMKWSTATSGLYIADVSPVTFINNTFIVCTGFADDTTLLQYSSSGILVQSKAVDIHPDDTIRKAYYSSTNQLLLLTTDTQILALNHILEKEWVYTMHGHSGETANIIEMGAGYYLFQSSPDAIQCISAQGQSVWEINLPDNVQGDIFKITDEIFGIYSQECIYLYSMEAIRVYEYPILIEDDEYLTVGPIAISEKHFAVVLTKGRADSAKSRFMLFELTI